MGSHATIVTQRDQVRAARQAEARTKRATVYTAFLAEAEQFASATRTVGDATIGLLSGKPSRGRFRSCLRAMLSGAAPGKIARGLSEGCQAFVLRISTDPLAACSPQGETRLCRAFNRARASYQPVRANFQGALNAVYVYGSRAAVHAARMVASGLPPSLPTTKPTYGAVVEDRSFRVGYNAFLDVMCR